MIIKTYLVKNMNEVQELMERDLGPHAMILTTRYIKPKGIKSFFSQPQIEVTVAVEDSDLHHNNRSTSYEERDVHLIKDELVGQLNENLVSIKQFFKQQEVIPKQTSLLESSRRLMNQLLSAASQKTERKQEIAEEANPNKISDLAHFLISKGIAESIACDIVSKVRKRLGSTENSVDSQLRTEGVNILKKELMSHLKIFGPITLTRGQPKVIAFVGPAGSGKTTTLMKIALQYVNELQKKVALITLDVNRIGAYEQCSALAQNFDLPLMRAAHVSELQEALRMYDDCDLLLIDTAGCSQYQWQKVDELADVLSIINGLEVHLVLSAATKDIDTLGAIQQFSRLNIESLIFTKLDETIADGVFINACQKTGKAISYLTNGPKIPEDLLIANADEMTRSILVQHNSQEFEALRQLAYR